MISISLARFRENLLAAGVSNATAATLVGLKPSTLSAAFREIQNLGSVKESQMLTTSFRLIEISESLKPLPLPTDISSLERLVEKLENGELTPEAIRSVVSSLFE